MSKPMTPEQYAAWEQEMDAFDAAQPWGFERIADAEDYAHARGLDWPQIFFVLLVAFLIWPVRFVRSLWRARR